ncbi:MAG: FtsQ-type POTRA domain-containing protein [Clostridia bacterium]|nr:FtsQ-type POTRA domain-containing protein [Clostridia bacterium]
MNSERQPNVAARPQGEGMLSPNRRPKAVKKKPNEKVVRVLFLSMAATSILIVLVSLALLILPLFRVQSIKVEGIELYTEEQIIAASGIQIGDEIVGMDLQEICDRITAQCHVNCEIVTGPFSVKIIIEEVADMKQMAVGDKTVILDREFEVLEILENGETPFSPLLSVKLPACASIRLGEPIRFANESASMTYVATLCDALRAKGHYEDVSYIDFSMRTSISYLYRDRFRVDLGSISDVDAKLNGVERLLKQLEEDGTDLTQVYAILDVSNLSKMTCKLCHDASELF